MSCGAGGAQCAAEPERPCPRLQQPGTHCSGVGRLRQSRLDAGSSTKPHPAAVQLPSRLGGLRVPGGSGEVPPAQQGPSVSFRNFPGKRCGCSSDPPRPPQLARLAQLAFAMAFPPRLRARLGFAGVFGFALPWAFSVVREARASLRAGPGPGAARAELASPGSAPAFRLRGHRQMLLPAGRLWEGSLPVLPAAPRAAPLPSIPSQILTQTGAGGVCAPERLGRCWQCDVGCRQQPAAPSAFCLGSCLRLVCHPAALRGVCCRLPPSEHPEGWDSFLYSPCPALCPSPPVSKQRRPPCAGSHCQG